MHCKYGLWKKKKVRSFFRIQIRHDSRRKGIKSRNRAWIHEVGGGTDGRAGVQIPPVFYRILSPPVPFGAAAHTTATA